MESKRTLEVLDRSLGGFYHGGCPKDTSRKLNINFQVSTCLGSAPSPMCLQSVIKESKWTLEVGSLEHHPRVLLGVYEDAGRS